MTKTYQGYTNYETWRYCSNVNNNQEQLNYVLELARNFKYSKHDLSQFLKQKLEANIPDIAAMESINWYEVANYYLEQV